MTTKSFLVNPTLHRAERQIKSYLPNRHDWQWLHGETFVAIASPDGDATVLGNDLGHWWLDAEGMADPELRASAEDALADARKAIKTPDAQR